MTKGEQIVISSLEINEDIKERKLINKTDCFILIGYFYFLFFDRSFHVGRSLLAGKK
jgi:hypothetical protein